MKIESIYEHLDLLDEIITLTQKEWGSYANEEEFQQKLNRKKKQILELEKRNDYAKLVLLEGTTLIGFISLFPTDGEEHQELTPWYATMYVKEEYRGRGYSRLLHEALLKEAKKRGYSKVYLKTDLKNYYEKWGAIYLDTLSNGEKLYYFQIEE